MQIICFVLLRHNLIFNVYREIIVKMNEKDESLFLKNNERSIMMRYLNEVTSRAALRSQGRSVRRSAFRIIAGGIIIVRKRFAHERDDPGTRTNDWGDFYGFHS